jgi:hypothetical protein
MVLVFRFLQGGAGSVGATLVGGSIADVWAAHERGGKMAGPSIPYFHILVLVSCSPNPFIVLSIRFDGCRRKLHRSRHNELGGGEP